MTRPTLLFALFFLAAPARAVDIEGLGGSDWDTRSQGFQYAGAGAARWLSEAWGARLRVMESHVRYSFDSGGQNLTGNIYATTPSLGALYKRGTFTAGLALGADVRSTKRTLAAGGSETKGETGVSLQGELDYWFAHYYDASLMASYAGVDDFFWSRARLKRQLTNLDYSGPSSWFAGAEVSGAGNSDYKSWQLGPMVEYVYRPANLSAAVKGGYRHTTAYAGAAYLGFELYVKY